MKISKVKLALGSLFLIAVVIGAYFLLRTPEKQQTQISISDEPSADGNLTREPELEKLEKSVLKNADSAFQIRREGSTLTITTNSGKTLKYVDDLTPGDHTLIYYVAASVSKPPALILAERLYEGSAFNLILANGEVVMADYYPFFSPSGDRFAVVNHTEAYNFDGWAIWQKSGSSFKQVKVQSPAVLPGYSRVGLIFQRWDGENKIIVNASISKDQANPGCAPGALNFDGNDWKLDIDLGALKSADCKPVPPGLEDQVVFF